MVNPAASSGWAAMFVASFFFSSSMDSISLLTMLRLFRRPHHSSIVLSVSMQSLIFAMALMSWQASTSRVSVDLAWSIMLNPMAVPCCRFVIFLLVFCSISLNLAVKASVWPFELCTTWDCTRFSWRLVFRKFVPSSLRL